MRYKIMFAHLKSYQNILAVGLHRAGTTILARMIAEDTGHMFLPEEAFGFGNIKRFNALLYEDNYPKVIQCPFMLKQIVWYKDCMVVFVHRREEELIASLNSMTMEDGSKLNPRGFLGREAEQYHANGNIHENKLWDWQTWQKTQLPHLLEIHYDDLKRHKLFKEERNHTFRAAAHVY